MKESIGPHGEKRVKWIKKLLPLLIISCGIAVFFLLISMRQEPERIEQNYIGPLVEVIDAPPQKIRITVDGEGTVRPDAQISVVPQISGTIIWKNNSFKSGGSFSKGDTLCSVDPRDYRLAVRQSEAEVAQAEYRYELAKQESALAKKEWQNIHGDKKTPSDLALQIPQLKASAATLSAAQARLEEATLRLERTSLRAPFYGRVRNVQADVGQQINAGQPIAQIYSIERAEIVVPIPDKDLAWFTLPLPKGLPEKKHSNRNFVSDLGEEKRSSSLSYGDEGAEALIEGVFAGSHSVWSGRVTRTEGEIDPQSRMARVIVEVDNPYGNIDSGGPPLMVGMFVNVAITGRYLDDVRIVPRGAIRQGPQEDVIWICDTDNRLRFRSVELIRRIDNEMLINVEMNPNERVIVSQISGATDGMTVRISAVEKETGS